MSQTTKLLDVRPLVCGQRHALIFDTFENLAVGEVFEFINDHDPKPLYHQLVQRYGDQVGWQYIERGPEVWRLAVSRIAAGEAVVYQADETLNVQANTGADTMQIIDVRQIIPRDRHPLIFQTFDALAVGEGFELVNDHDPKPLYYQFFHERPGQFSWEYLEQGPSVWRVNIRRTS